MVFKLLHVCVFFALSTTLFSNMSDIKSNIEYEIERFGEGERKQLIFSFRLFFMLNFFLFQTLIFRCFSRMNMTFSFNPAFHFTLHGFPQAVHKLSVVQRTA